MPRKTHAEALKEYYAAWDAFTAVSEGWLPSSQRKINAAQVRIAAAHDAVAEAFTRENPDGKHNPTC